MWHSTAVNNILIHLGNLAGVGPEDGTRNEALADVSTEEGEDIIVEEERPQRRQPSSGNRSSVQIVCR
jgi:hypothetical protein